MGGLNVGGYHLFNLVIHAASALLLLGIVQRFADSFFTWKKGGLRDGGHSFMFVACVCLIWALHPLQTASVTYVVQRAESLAGCLFLLTLYCFIRSTESQKHERRWFLASVAACFAGVATKETVATAPLVVLLYDRAFVAKTFAAAWRERHRFYLTLFASWLLLAALVLANRGRGGSVGFASDITTWSYLLTQCLAITRYLWLACWPNEQIFDYGSWHATHLSEVFPQALFVVALFAGTIWALRRNSALGFLGAIFFLILAPSSSVIPIATQTIAEHRMYLPLAAVVLSVALAVKNSFERLRIPDWCLTVVLLIAAAALGAKTYGRNEVFRSSVSLWQDTVSKRPNNPRAHNNLGLALMNHGDGVAAAEEFRRTIELQPNHAFAHFNLGTLLLKTGRFEAAATEFKAALSADSHFVNARINLGDALTHLGRPQEAISEYRIVLEQEPTAEDARTNLAALLLQEGKEQEAVSMLRQALAAQPELAEAHYHFGMALDRQGDAAGAEWEFREAVRLKPELAAAQVALGNVLARRKEAGAAKAAYEEALRRDPRAAEAHYGLGNLLAREQNFSAAIEQFNAALSIDPDYLEARNNLANCQLVTGHFTEAISNYEAVLRARQGDQTALANLALARELLRGGVK